MPYKLKYTDEQIAAAYHKANGIYEDAKAILGGMSSNAFAIRAKRLGLLPQGNNPENKRSRTKKAIAANRRLPSGLVQKTYQITATPEALNWFANPTDNQRMAAQARGALVDGLYRVRSTATDKFEAALPVLVSTTWLGMLRERMPEVKTFEALVALALGSYIDGTRPATKEG